VAVDVEEADIEDAHTVHGATENRDGPSSLASYSCATKRWIDATVIGRA
jgi:hypothetical protein